MADLEFADEEKINALVFKFNEPALAFTALSAARLLCDIQHLILLMHLVDENDVGSEFNFTSYDQQKYQSMIVADGPRGSLSDYSAFLTSFNYNSPPLIGLATLIGIKAGTIKFVKSMIDFLLFHRPTYEAKDADAALKWQHVEREVTKNLAAKIKLAEKIPDEKMREQVLSNLYMSITPFVDGRHPTLLDITPTPLPSNEDKFSQGPGF